MLETDYHSHLIPNVDDGSRGALETVQMGRALADLGVQRAHVTPHRYRMGWGMPPDEVHRQTDAVRRLLDRAEIEVELVPSTEHFFCLEMLEAIVDGAPLTSFPWPDSEDELEQAVLVEVPTRDPVVGVRAMAKRLHARGLRALMAHPERTRSLVRNPGRMDGWRDAGWRFQLDLLSLVGAYGRDAQMLSEQWVVEDRYDVVGSDVHRPSQISMLYRAHDRWRELRASVSKNPSS